LNVTADDLLVAVPGLHGGLSRPPAIRASLTLYPRQKENTGLFSLLAGRTSARSDLMYTVDQPASPYPIRGGLLSEK
jgi:hypothetical protein